MRFRHLLLLVAAVSCSSSSATPGPSGPTTSLFVVPASLDDLADTHFYDHPWPSDLRKEADGTVRFKGFYNPHLTILIDGYVNALKGLLKGFSPVAFGYFR